MECNHVTQERAKWGKQCEHVTKDRAKWEANNVNM